MKILEFDGTDVTFESLEPKWTIEEVDVMHQHRVQDALEEHGFPTEWIDDRIVWYPEAQRFVEREGLDRESLANYGELPLKIQMSLGELNCRDHRERIGMRRSDGKPIQRRTRKVTLDKLADEFGIPTRDPGWEELTLTTLSEAPAKGRITVRTL